LKDVSIQRLHRLDLNEIAHLAQESRDEGFRHITRLSEQYESGTNRFDQPGEALFAARDRERIIGICGLNQDPYSMTAGVGRVRRLYVSKLYRRHGVARWLMEQVIEEAKRHYSVLVLKTDHPIADRFYDSLGFISMGDNDNVSHMLRLDGRSGSRF